MEIEESEIFEITDYTNVTDWEKFISKVEELITLLENSHLSGNAHTNDLQKLTFQKFELNLQLFQPSIKGLDNLSNCNEDTNVIETSEVLTINENRTGLNESENDIHWELVKWFGRKKYIVFTPSKGTSIYGQDHINQLISSITIAAVNIKCQLPIIIKYGMRNWPLYQGVQFVNDFKIQLQFASIKYTPKQCMHLSGIRRVFQEKLAKSYVSNDDIVVSAKYLYVIENFPNTNENYFKGIIHPTKKKMHFFQFMSVGFGKDPIKNVKLFVHWTQVPKHVLTYTDCPSLPISTATGFYAACNCENSYDGILYKTMRKLLKSFLVAQKSSEILQEIESQAIDTLHINQPLLKLTKFPISNHHLFDKSSDNQNNAEKSGVFTGSKPELLDAKMLMDILWFIFPDGRPNSENLDQQPYSTNPNLNLPHYHKLLKRFPNANQNHLIHRLAICLTNLLSYHKEGIKCFSYVWMEVVLELRYRLENGIPLPDTNMGENFKNIKNASATNKDEIFAKLLAESIPHLGSCQLEQRLQLLNYCILTRLRNQALYQCGNIGMTENSDSDETTELFFDCETDNYNEMLNNGTTPEPRGRLRKFEEHKLINHPDISLYIPITQVLSVDIYSKWKQAKHDQSREFLEHHHAASLRADMSAFKAANPGCVIEDFIRWYSPKDFIESEDDCNTSTEVKGELSSRMLGDNNTWLNSWESAAAIPALLQKRLFDDTIAAETALKWMQDLTSAEISSSLINNVLIDSLNALVECVDEQDPPEFLRQIDSASLALIKFFDTTDIMDVTGSELEFYQIYDELISHFQRIEYFLAVKTSLHHKFVRNFSGPSSDLEQIISWINSLLISTNEIAISKKHLSSTVYEYILGILISMYKIAHFLENQEVSLGNIDQILTKTNKKEYVLCLNFSYPFPTSRKSNQRLYVCSSDEEFVISTNICEDITYF